MAQKKYFTLAEASALLPVIQQELTALQKLKTEYHEKYYELKIAKHSQPLDEESIFKLECKLEFLEIEAELHVKNIHSQGIQLKDIDHGLIDFPAMIDGQEVLLCWKQGEPQITKYHGLQEGFSGRKDIPPHFKA